MMNITQIFYQSFPTRDEEIMGFTTLVTNMEVREYLNAGLIALNGIVLVMIGRQLLHTFRSGGWKWRDQPGAMFAVCLWWSFLSDFARACLAWYLLHEQNSGRAMNYLTPAVTILYISAAVVATAATLRLVYALSPQSWGHRGWVTALVCTVALVFGLNMVD